MALNADNVRVAITGGFYYDPTGLGTAPTGTGSSITGMPDVGYISEEGISLKMPGAGDSTSLKAWQNGATVRTIRTPPADNPEVSLTLMETKLETIELAFGVKVTQNSQDGEFVINTNVERKPVPVVIDVIDADSLIRVYAPRAVVTAIDTLSLKNGEAIGYPVTIALEYDQAIGGQAKVWMTALKSS